MASDASQANRDDLEKAFLTRTRRTLERVAERASPEDLRDGLTATTDIGGLARLLSPDRSWPNRPWATWTPRPGRSCEASK